MLPSLRGEQQYARDDGFGSVRLIKDGAGNAAGAATYEPWGAPRGGSATLGGFGFTGEQTDAETGLVYLRARHYDPASGRFLQADSWLGTVGSPQSHHLFAYGNNNPALFTDPSGHFAIVIPAAVAWAVPYLGAVAVLSCLANPYCRDLMAELTVAAWNGTAAFQQQAADQLRRMITQQNSSSSAGSQPSGQQAPKLVYEPSPKHGPVQRGNISPAPTNGQAALDDSVLIKGTSSRRAGVDCESGEVAVFDATYPGSGIYHGHVPSWDQLRPEIKAALQKAGLVDKKGRPIPTSQRK